MKDGPSIAPVAALAGDPARANMLAALSAGMALTASELAGEAGVTLQTASSHLAKLERAGLISATPQGRHRYFRLADNDVAQMLESIMNVAARTGQMRTRPGPCDPALRRARICYDHLAGEMGVGLLDGLVGKECVVRERDELRLTQAGIAFMTNLRIDIDQLSNQRRPLCRPCLDWSMRRHHLGGALGAALLKKFQELRWIARIGESRALRFTPSGEIQFLKIFGAVVPQSQA